MTVTVLLGLQWGDEGKGKVVDILGEQADLIARYNGGDNAGHTLNVDGQTYKLHFIPSGILRPNVVSIMGGGMVIHPVRLLAEMDALAGQGVDISPESLKLASTAHLILPSHQALEAAKEARLGGGKIGTTGRGIGPTYASKAAREGLRAEAMQNPSRFAQAVGAFIEEQNGVLTAYGAPTLDPRPFMDEYARAAERLAPYLIDVSPYVNRALRAGQRLLAEGGQATLLDIDHGNYPYVTSSNATVGGALTGLGIGPKHIERVVGVAKAFCTRVGEGPFPTEQANEIGALMRGDGSRPWDDFGTTTGRPRRCGWLDLVALRYALDVNGVTDLALMKLDILGRFETLQVAVAYEIDGHTVTDYPLSREAFARAKPIYETLDGWGTDIMGARRLADLPPAARAFITWLERQLDVPLSLVSVGPGREETLGGGF
jgi:adenylosuccinate synthase